MATTKRSVAFDPAVAAEALALAGERGFSRFVNDAVAQRLQAIRIEALYAEFVERTGPVPDDVRREVAAAWDDPNPVR